MKDDEKVHFKILQPEKGDVGGDGRGWGVISPEISLSSRLIVSYLFLSGSENPSISHQSLTDFTPGNEKPYLGSGSRLDWM